MLPILIERAGKITIGVLQGKFEERGEVQIKEEKGSHGVAFPSVRPAWVVTSCMEREGEKPVEENQSFSFEERRKRLA